MTGRGRLQLKQYDLILVVDKRQTRPMIIAASHCPRGRR